MNSELPEEYIVQQILQYAGYPNVKRDGTIESGCPICHEGTSWGKKRRLFYIPEYGNFHCKNCQRSWYPITWIMQVSGKTYSEIIQEAKEYEYVPADLICRVKEQFKVKSESLPKNSINLSDPHQLSFYAKNTVVIAALALIDRRRLNVAVNKPTTYYVSLDDYIHKNRLCIPFESESGSIDFFQTRSMFTGDTSPKYLGKVGGDKSVFGINRISEKIDYIFKFEGPIDSTFVKNGVGLCGVTQSTIQTEQLKRFPFHQQIWVLDNQHIDRTARDKTRELIDRGERVFIWPKSDTLKDFNDLAIKSKINEIPTNFILQTAFSGLQAKLKFKQLFDR